MRLASTAAVEARIAAANLHGLRRHNDGAVGIFSTKIGDLALGAAAQEAGFAIVTGEASAPDRHPGCMPDASELTVKLIFESHSNVILGGQAYGGSSTGEVTNFIGALIQQKARAEDIAIFQVGTHPALTASPIVYQIVNAAENALIKHAMG